MNRRVDIIMIFYRKEDLYSLPGTDNIEKSFSSKKEVGIMIHDQVPNLFREIQNTMLNTNIIKIALKMHCLL